MEEAMTPPDPLRQVAEQIIKTFRQKNCPHWETPNSVNSWCQPCKAQAIYAALLAEGQRVREKDAKIVAVYHAALGLHGHTDCYAERIEIAEAIRQGGRGC